MSRKAADDDATYPAQTSGLAEWTIMIYLAGDNNLSANSIAIMQDLEDVNHHPDVHVVACFDPNTPRPRGARYLEVNRRPNPNTVGEWHLHNDLVPFDDIPGHPVAAPDFCNPDPPDTATTEPIVKEGLSRFLKFALRRHPARKYMLILFGHGSAVAGNTFLADNNPPSFLRLEDFAEVLARHFDDRTNTPRKPVLDILACDNCVMNGIEAAYEIRGQVKYVLGSQGLMLALGWPFRKLINVVTRCPTFKADRVARRMLRVCARNLIDFSLMDRSTEQAVCDLTTLRAERNLVTAVKRLSRAMQNGLELDEHGHVRYPSIRDAIRLARLEAQSYWGETFVDLYDFCKLLMERCNETLKQVFGLIEDLDRLRGPMRHGRADDVSLMNPRQITAMRLMDAIAEGCDGVLRQIKGKGMFVPHSYYIGPELQYSNGVSVYFPWSLPENPLIFEPVDAEPNGSGGSYGLSWVSQGRLSRPPRDFKLVTPFEEYKRYAFAKRTGGDWAAFLEDFFRATLRDVRRFDVKYERAEEEADTFFNEKVINRNQFVPPAAVDLQKSGSDVDSEEDCTCPTIKNYPRRFYVSPADCLRRCDLDGSRADGRAADEKKEKKPSENEDSCASYLGWNLRGIVAQVIHEREPGDRPVQVPDCSDTSDDDLEPEAADGSQES